MLYSIHSTYSMLYIHTIHTHLHTYNLYLNDSPVSILCQDIRNLLPSLKPHAGPSILTQTLRTICSELLDQDFCCFAVPHSCNYTSSNGNANL